MKTQCNGKGCTKNVYIDDSFLDEPVLCNSCFEKEGGTIETI